MLQLSKQVYNICLIAAGTICMACNQIDFEINSDSLIKEANPTTDAQRFQLNIELKGLSSGSVTLQNSGADDLTLTSNGTYPIGASKVPGTPYSISVSSQPTGSIHCNIGQPDGTLGNSDIVIAVFCTDTYSEYTAPVTFGRHSFEDINGDGWLDFYAGHNSTDEFTVFINDKNLGFTPTTYSLGTAISAKIFKYVDLNKDGHRDAIYRRNVSFNDSKLVVQYNNGSNVFGPAGQFNTDGRSEDIEVADFDRDGELDILITNNGLDTIRIFWGDSTTPFTTSYQSPDLLDNYQASLCDCSSDGRKLDFVSFNHTGNSSRTITRFLNNYDRTFTLTDFGDGVSSVAVYGGSEGVDINNDGYDDFIVGANYGSSMQSYISDGIGGYNVNLLAETGSMDTKAINILDLDCDGDMDFMASRYDNAASNAHSFHINNGLGIFTEEVYITGSAASLSTNWNHSGDFNNDGCDDLMVTPRSDPTKYRIYWGPIYGRP